MAEGGGERRRGRGKEEGEGRGGQGKGRRRKGEEGGRGVSPPKHKNLTPPMLAVIFKAAVSISAAESRHSFFFLPRSLFIRHTALKNR
jgi:hypothetical protein